MPRIQSEAAEELGQIVQYLEHLLRCAKRVAISPSFQQSWSEWRAAEGKDVTTVQQQTPTCSLPCSMLTAARRTSSPEESLHPLARLLRAHRQLRVGSRVRTELAATPGSASSASSARSSRCVGLLDAPWPDGSQSRHPTRQFR